MSSTSGMERRWQRGLSRRRALLGLAGALAGSPLLGRDLAAQLDPRPFAEHRRTPGLEEMLTAFDFEPVMFNNVPLATYDYTAHGDGSEFTLRRNREVFDWVDLLPGGAAVDPASVDLSTEVLGTRMTYPILIAPTARMTGIHPSGEAGMREAATAAAGTPMILSQNTGMPAEQVAAAATSPLWFQFYPRQDPAEAREVLDEAQSAGCRAIVVTVDQQASYYERTQQNRHLGGTPAPPTGGGRGQAAGAPATGAARYRVSTRRLWYTWQTLEQIKAMVQVPVLVKGILTPEDAVLCIEHGMDGIIVSNHGGRSMDYGPSTLEVLPEIVAAVGGRIPVLTDSGYRRGTDILKALALGAQAVLLGRTTRWGLGAFGAPGVQRLLEIMQRELVQAAAASGRRTLSEIDASIVRPDFG